MNKPLFDRIVFNVCSEYNVSTEQLVTKDRKGEFTYPRQLIMYLAVKFNVGTYTEIANFFNRDHATVNNSIKSIRNYYETDPLKKETINNCEKKIRSDIEFKSILELFESEIKEIKNEMVLLELRYLKLKEKVDILLETIRG